jgi:hypothetical protein
MRPVRIEVMVVAGCPHAAEALAAVRRCIARLGLDVAVIESQGDHPSPSVRVNGRDIMGEAVTAGPACRLDVPSEAQLMRALGAAAGVELR